MPANILNQLPEIDLISFLLGLFLGGLLWAIILRAVKVSRSSKKIYVAKKEKFVSKSTAQQVETINASTLRICQSNHLAGFLFPLSRIYVSTELIYPYPYVDPSQDSPDAYESSQALPYIPENPEYYENIPLPTSSLLSALLKHNLISIQGEIGTGKSTMINAAVSDIIEKTGDGLQFENRLPLYFHGSEIEINISENTDPFLSVIQAAQFSELHLPEMAIKNLLTSYADSNNLILFIDGLDELDNQSLNQYIGWIQNILVIYPQMRIVVTVNLAYSDDLEKLGFVTYYISPLNHTMRQTLRTNWANALFNNSIRDSFLAESAISEIDSIWSNQNNLFSNFFFTTLSLINDYSFSGISGTQISLLQSYILRFCIDLEDYEHLKKLAEEIYIRNDHLIESDVINKLLRRNADLENRSSIQLSESEIVQRGETLFQKLVRSRVIIERKPNYFGFNSLLIFGFLLGDSYTRKTDSNWDYYFSNPLEETALRFSPQSDYLLQWIQQTDSPVHRNISLLSKHISKCEGNTSEFNRLAPVIIKNLENTSIAFSSRLKYLSLLQSIDSQYALKIYEFLNSKKTTSNKQLVALGLGFHKSTESISLLKSIFHDSSVLEKIFCTFSLFRLWDSTSRKLIMDSLTTGDDFFKRIICEMLACRLPEGKNTLLDISSNGSIAMRKASIFGLKLINDPEIVEHITRRIAEEKEWIVRDAAVRALEEINTLKLRLNNNAPPPPDQSDWLVEYASKHGTGISANTIPHEILIDVVRSGNDPEKFAALNILRNYPSSQVIEYLTSLTETQDYIGDRAYFYLSELLKKQIPH
jgi:HEAT repeat protein